MMDAIRGFSALQRAEIAEIGRLARRGGVLA